jgi:hypothetical protein
MGAPLRNQPSKAAGTVPEKNQRISSVTCIAGAG